MPDLETIMALRPWILAAVLATAACAGDTEPEPDATDEAAATNPDTPELTPEQLSEAESVTLVPSPVETQRALESAGIDTELSELITERELDVNNDNLDNAAVRTGVVIADMLLSVKSSSKDTLLTHLAQVETGMRQLDGGKDILRTLNDIEERVKADAVTRDELLKELDELSGAVIPELEFEGKDRVVPLIQAGSWLEGANLLARAAKKAGKPETASGLLKQPQVVAYFLDYVRTEGSEKAPAAVTEKLESSLLTLKGISEQSEPLSEEDIDTVIQTTNDVLALL